MTAFIQCENLVKIYKVASLEVVALQGLDLTVKEGEIIGLVGPSGSGKSTLMNVLGGLDVPSAGRVNVAGHNLVEMNRRDQVFYRRNIVGFIWQQTSDNLLPYLTTRQNVEMPMAFKGIGARERRQRTQQLLEQVGLEDRMDYKPGLLSGGEQQRAALAVAMANHPRLILADEPTGEVDSESAGDIFDTVETLNREYGVTIVVVTHSYEIAKRLSRVVGMSDGRTSVEVLSRRGKDGATLTEEEFAVLDRTGRLQLPQAYLENLQMKNLVRLQLRSDHIAVYPDEQVNREGRHGDD